MIITVVLFPIASTIPLPMVVTLSVIPSSMLACHISGGGGGGVWLVAWVPLVFEVVIGTAYIAWGENIVVLIVGKVVLNAITWGLLAHTL